jgi:uncharacterized protein
VFLYPGSWPYVLVALAAFLGLSLLAGQRVTRSFAHYSRRRDGSGTRGMDVASRLLAHTDLSHVRVQVDRGDWADSYDPRTRMLHLSSAVATGTSVAAAAVVAHEVGHAQQDASGYAPMRWRSRLVPVAYLCWQAGPMILLAGLILSGVTAGAGRTLGFMLAEAGLTVFAVVVLFQLVTTRVELDASRRALGLLAEDGAAVPEEQAGARRVLRAAAFTYWAGLGGIPTLLSGARLNLGNRRGQ